MQIYIKLKSNIFLSCVVVFFYICWQNVLLCQATNWDQHYRSYDIVLSQNADTLEYSYEIGLVKDEEKAAKFVTADRDTFLTLLSKDLARLDPGKSSSLIYIHGFYGNQKYIFNYTKEELKRWYLDKQHSDIARIISIKWPGDSPIYKIAKGKAHQIAPQLASSFVALVDTISSLTKSPDLIAHSLGCEFFTAMVVGLEEPTTPMFDQILLCAPDLDVDVFNETGDLSNLSAFGNRITTYHSNRDMTLTFSQKLNKRDRLGLNGPDTLMLANDKLSFVEVSEIKDDEDLPVRITGHSYYRSSPKITEDMLFVLLGFPRNKISNRQLISEKNSQYKLVLEQ